MWSWHCSTCYDSRLRPPCELAPAPPPCGLAVAPRRGPARARRHGPTRAQRRRAGACLCRREAVAEAAGLLAEGGFLKKARSRAVITPHRCVAAQDFGLHWLQQLVPLIPGASQVAAQVCRFRSTTPRPYPGFNSLASCCLKGFDGLNFKGIDGPISCSLVITAFVLCWHVRRLLHRLSVGGLRL
jgi:hypothetical protein